VVSPGKPKYIFHIIGGIIALILIIYFLREFWAWYFKTNEILEVLKEIRNLLKNNNA